MEKTTFNDIADSYDTIFKEFVAAHYTTKRARFIKKIFPDTRISILDVGCGTGSLLQALAAEGYNVKGVDNSAGMIKKALEKLPGMVTQADAICLPFPAGTFDLVITIVTLHHIAVKEKVRKVISEMARVAKHNGHLLIWEHNPMNPYWYLLMRRVPQDTGEERLIYPAEILRSFKNSSVIPVDIWKKGFVPDFIPACALSFFVMMEKGMEQIPGINVLLAHNVILGRKK